MKEKRQMDLGKDNLRGLVLKVALPVVAAQLVNMLYNIVDRMYIGRIADIGTVALAGVGVCLPISILIMAFSQLVGSGGAPQASIELGKSNHTKAEKILGSCMVPLVVIAAILTAVLLMFGKRLLPILGATGASQPYAWEYLKITSLGTIFTVFVMGLNSFINTQGKTGVGMFSVIIGAVLNIIFDPVLIFGFHMGVKGAATATVISQAISCLWVVGYLCSPKSSLRIKVKNLVPDMKILKGVIVLGIAPFLLTGLESVVTIILNMVLKRYGALALTGYSTDGATLAITISSIVTMTSSLITMPITGFTQGIQPIISYNYGAGKQDRVKKTIQFSVIICTAFIAVMCAVFLCTPQVLAGMFSGDMDVIAISAPLIRIFISGMAVLGIQYTLQVSFVARGIAPYSILIALIRKAVYIPLLFILPILSGASGGITAIFVASPISDVVAALVTVAIFFATYKKYAAQEILSLDNRVQKTA